MQHPTAVLDLVAFCAFGTMSETQLFALTAVDAMRECDPEKVFAETLCLVSTATERAAISGFGSTGDSSAQLVESLRSFPYTLQAYVAGGEVLGGGQSDASVLDNTGDLERMMHFYGTHLSEKAYPDSKLLRHTMILWMGRISPPKLDEHPEARLDRLNLLDRLVTHVRLVHAFARNAAQSDSTS